MLTSDVQPKETLQALFSAVEPPAPQFSWVVFQQNRESILQRDTPIDCFDSMVLSIVRNQLFALAKALEATDANSIVEEARRFAEEIQKVLVRRALL